MHRQKTRMEDYVEDHYNARKNQSVDERRASPIIGLKNLNNQIKRALIEGYVRRGDAVLDLACGKGGDLFKWDKAEISYYVGIDIASGSIEDCRERYYKNHRHKFPARLICKDCFGVGLIKEELAEEVPFDICNCQFALHYSWSSEARTRQALANISAIMRPGGFFIGTLPDANAIVDKLTHNGGSLVFGNSIYRISFDEKMINFFEEEQQQQEEVSSFGIQYHFQLQDAVDCPEWLVNFDVFTALALEYGLQLVFACNFGPFVQHHLSRNRKQQHMSPDEWEVACLYLAFAFRKLH